MTKDRKQLLTARDAVQVDVRFAGEDARRFRELQELYKLSAPDLLRYSLRRYYEEELEQKRKPVSNAVSSKGARK